MKVFYCAIHEIYVESKEVHKPCEYPLEPRISEIELLNALTFVQYKLSLIQQGLLRNVD